MKTRGVSPTGIILAIKDINVNRRMLLAILSSLLLLAGCPKEKKPNTDQQSPPPTDSEITQNNNPRTLDPFFDKLESPCKKRDVSNESGSTTVRLDLPANENMGDPVGSDQASELARYSMVVKKQEAQNVESVYRDVQMQDTDTGKQITFRLLRPNNISNQIGQTFDVAVYQKLTNCPYYQDGDPVIYHEYVIRDKDGAILFVNSGMGLLPSNQVLRKSEVTPEIAVDWVDVGCPAIEETPGEKDIPVGVRCRSSSSGEEIIVKPGERKTIRIGNHDYFFETSYAHVPKTFPAPGSCSFAVWTIYRKGFFGIDHD